MTKRETEKEKKNKAARKETRTHSTSRSSLYKLFQAVVIGVITIPTLLRLLLDETCLVAVVTGVTTIPTLLRLLLDVTFLVVVAKVVAEEEKDFV